MMIKKLRISGLYIQFSHDPHVSKEGTQRHAVLHAWITTCRCLHSEAYISVPPFRGIHTGASIPWYPYRCLHSLCRCLHSVIPVCALPLTVRDKDNWRNIEPKQEISTSQQWQNPPPRLVNTMIGASEANL